MQLAEAVRELEKEGIHKKAIVHVKVDTGMSRIGITPDERGFSFVQKLLAVREIEAEGILTHFARADEENKAFTEKQFESFSSFIKMCIRDRYEEHHFHSDSGESVSYGYQPGLPLAFQGLQSYSASFPGFLPV